ncbi:MAG TPA: hypothetical protein VN753_08710 [Terracidiphilus sp.]|nr:hypothetical protein [Terracidiphilus sp.]
MSRVGWLGQAVLAASVVVAPVVAQEKAAPPDHAMVMPDVDQHLKILTEKLELNAEQQEKARPILKGMQDAVQKDMDDKTQTPDQVRAKVHTDFMKADKELREFLTEEQKTKLDDMEKQMHHESSDQK